FVARIGRAGNDPAATCRPAISTPRSESDLSSSFTYACHSFSSAARAALSLSSRHFMKTRTTSDASPPAALSVPDGFPRLTSLPLASVDTKRWNFAAYLSRFIRKWTNDQPHV